MEVGILIVVIIIGLISILLKDSPNKAGKRGEQIVVKNTSKYLDDNTYKAIHDVTLPTKSGSTQIDHIIVSKYGIFVIETKNWQGWIFGGEKQKTWTQVNYQYKNKYMNPLHQNYGHVKALQSILRLPINYFHSVVIFAENGEFKTNMPDNVIYDYEFDDYINSKNVVILSDEDVDKIISKIKSVQLVIE